MKNSAIKIQEEEVKQSNRKFYKNIFYVGMTLFLIGELMTAKSAISFYFTGGGLLWFCSSFLKLLGSGQIFYGLKGLFEEK